MVVRTEDLGRMAYAPALEVQHARHAEVLSWRDGGDNRAPAPPVGVVLFVEHDPPVITVSRRAGTMAHLTASQEMLAREGVEVCETDRGGDITYHGPGQLVAYPILDLNRLGLGLHAYMRMLEGVVIDTCGAFGVACWRDPSATGVWTGDQNAVGDGGAKISAMGIRVRRWVTLHGLALNVSTNLRHFDLIVPCGLVGRRVTSLDRELGRACPTMEAVKRVMAERFAEAIAERLNRA